MKIVLGKFASTASRLGLRSDLPAVARDALADFAARLQSGPAPLGLPRFLRAASPEDPHVTFDLSLDDELWAVLEEEAARQGATVSQLASHSVLLYLAEADRLGRASSVVDPA